ncbi:MAG: hypothetical protein ACP5I3_11760 [Thermoproteus sp.]
MIGELLEISKLRRIFGHFYSAVGGYRAIRLWRAWNKYYARQMCLAARTCWDGSVRDTLTETLNMVCPYADRGGDEPPRRPLPPLLQEWQGLMDWALENICQALSGSIPEVERRAKYAKFLNTAFYRQYRQSLYRSLLVPLVKKGAETVLTVGAGLAEPFDIAEALRREGLAARIIAQEVDPAVAKALAAAGFEVFLGELWQYEDAADVITVQSVLHWAEDPLRLLKAAAERGKYVIINQTYGPTHYAIHIFAAVVGARRVFHTWKEVDAMVREAGLVPDGGFPHVRRAGAYIGVFRGRR